MTLSKAALLALRGLDSESKRRLASDLNVSEKTVYRWLQVNSENLTQASAMKFIREKTGLEDEQILNIESMGLQN